MLFYGDIAPGGPARRVMTRLTPLPDTGYPQNSPFLPLALVLSARGMDVGPATLNAWSLQPFFCGYDPSSPGRVLEFSQAFDNAVANAGLSFNVQNPTGSQKAFAALREAVDRGHTPVIFIGKWERSCIKNLARILKCFHISSGLKVNFHKSRLFGIGVTDDELQVQANVLGCAKGSFPFMYLGIPVGANITLKKN